MKYILAESDPLSPITCSPFVVPYHLNSFVSLLLNALPRKID